MIIKIIADSGHSTMSTLRDIQDIESEYEANSFEEEYPCKTRRMDSNNYDSGVCCLNESVRVVLYNMFAV